MEDLRQRCRSLWQWYVCHAVFATGPLRHSPELCFRSQQDKRDLVIFCSLPSSFHLPSTCHPSTLVFCFLESRNKSASGYLRLKSCISQMPSSDIISNFALCLFSLTFSSLPLSLYLAPSLLFPCQIFEGNSNYDTPELRTVEPLLTRFIRIYPERATPAGMGLRVELLGCEIKGKKSQLKFTSFSVF